MKALRCVVALPVQDPAGSLEALEAWRGCAMLCPFAHRAVLGAAGSRDCGGACGGMLGGRGVPAALLEGELSKREAGAGLEQADCWACWV